MATSDTTVCFTCGLPVAEDAARLNYMENGKPCPACRDRLLESLPALLPKRPTLVEGPARIEGFGAAGAREGEPRGNDLPYSEDDPRPA